MIKRITQKEIREKIKKQKSKAEEKKRAQLISKIKEAEKIKTELESRKYLKDLYLFNKHVLKIDSGKDSVPLSTAHKQICQFIDEEKEKQKLLLVPRGHLKSTLVTVGRSVQKVCEDPQTRILIANATYALAVSFLDQIKSHLKSNETLHKYYGDFSQNSGKWSEKAIKIFAEGETGDYEKRENTITVAGIETSLTSQHYDMIIIDDGVNRENITTIEQIKKVYRFYQDCLDLLEPGGELIIIGTRWHDRDLYGWIMEGDVDNEGEIPKKILKEIMPYQFVYKGPHFNIMKRKVVEGKEPIWPEKFTQEHIDFLKKKKGPYEFSTQYNNEPVAAEDQVFIRDWFRYYEQDDLRDRNTQEYVMCDPAISQTDDADYTVITTISVDEYHHWFIREIIRERMLPNEIITAMFDVYERWHPTEMGIEVVAYQKMLAYSLNDEMKKRKKHLPLLELRPSTRQSKESRIKSLQPGYANGMIFHDQILANNEYLEDELIRFPRGSHDDIIDTLAYFTQFATAPKKGVSSNKGQKRSSKYLY